MSRVQQMITDILRREGGYVDHPADKGGPTKYGVTQETLARYMGRRVSVAEVKALSEGTARSIYLALYFQQPRLHLLPEFSQAFAFDCAINHGPMAAVRLIQDAANTAGGSAIKVDGQCGPMTASAVAGCDPELFMRVAVAMRAAFYLDIVRRKASQRAFLLGWLRRAGEFWPKR